MIFAVLLSSILLVSSSSDIESARAGIDVERYHFAIAVSDSTNEIHGRAEITVRFTEAIDSFFLDLVGELDGATGMTVEAVRSNDQPVAFEHSDNRLSMKVGAVSQGDKRTYVVHYSGIPGDGLIISRNKFGERTFFGDNWPNRARHWLPTVDHVSDKAFVEWSVTAPDRYQVVANGELVEELQQADGSRLTRWRSIAPISTKIMVIGVARFAVQHLEPVSGIPIQTWVYPSDRDAGFHDFAVAIPMMHYFTSQIGEFPYAKLANVQSTTRYGGMENASAIFYAEQGVTGRRANEGTVAHEVAHQWFGDSATEKDWHHVWLSEGFANYFTDLYWEHEYGRDQMIERLKSSRLTVINYHAAHPDVPVIDTRIQDPMALLNVNAYQKGEWFLHMLRNEIGTDHFWSGVREYYRRFRDSNAMTEDLRDIMEEESGQDLDAFFDQWLYRPGQPDLTASWTYDAEAGQVIIKIEQIQAEAFSFPLDIGISNADGGKTIERISVTDRSHTFTIDSQQAPRFLELDPNTNLLFTGRIE